jgi:hypothetical protein
MADVNIIDLWAWVTMKLQLQKRGYWNAGYLQSLVKKEKAAIAVVYESWFDKELTDQWE